MPLKLCARCIPGRGSRFRAFQTCEPFQRPHPEGQSPLSRNHWVREEPLPPIGGRPVRLLQTKTELAGRNFFAASCLLLQSIEVMKMMKKTVLALFGLVIAFALVAPPKANAQVAIGIGVGVPRPAYGYVVAPPPYAYAPAPYVAYAPGYAYPYGYDFYVGRGYGYGYGRYGWHGGYGYRGRGFEGRGYEARGGRGFVGRGGYRR